MDFIPVNKATEIILENASSFGEELISFGKARGRVLAEAIKSDRDMPPFDRVTMDGIGLQGKAYNGGQRVFKIEQIQFAGEPQKTLKDPKACIEVMTGASLPISTDSIIRYEDIEIDGGSATIKNELNMFRNVHGKGQDRKLGEVLLPAGVQLRSADLAVLATVGKVQVLVNKLLKVAVVTSGDELVDVSQVPMPHQIRKSNIYCISSLLEPYSAQIHQFHLKDNLEESISLLSAIFKTHDVVVLSGGVSAGKKDYLPEALKAAGVAKVFHKIQQRPGKPMWYGTKGNVSVFALPGNPVSSFMCAVRYVLPWLKKSIGLKVQKELAVLSENVAFKPPLSYFMQVTLSQKDAVLRATPVEGGGSGDLANLNLSHAFMELPKQDSSQYQKGTIYPIWRF
ncbi:MAG: molybdopterin molybdotransferase [Arcticibacterium sp.]|jgi:molybdopterin molybdotransferase